MEKLFHGYEDEDEVVLSLSLSLTHSLYEAGDLKEMKLVASIFFPGVHYSHIWG